MKWVRIGILALALIAVLALVIIKRNDIVPGWHTDGDAKYYVTFPLKRASGIETVSGSDYLFSEDGGHKLLYGWNKYDGYYYYSLPDGKIAKGETTVDGEQYYFDASTGKLYKSTTAILDGKLWYFNDRGFRTYGIVELDGQKFCFSETGNLKKGLQVIDGRTYYFDPENECMVYGLTTVGGDRRGRNQRHGLYFRRRREEDRISQIPRRNLWLPLKVGLYCLNKNLPSTLLCFFLSKKEERFLSGV